MRCVRARRRRLLQRAAFGGLRQPRACGVGDVVGRHWRKACGTGSRLGGDVWMRRNMTTHSRCRGGGVRSVGGSHDHVRMRCGSGGSVGGGSGGEAMAKVSPKKLLAADCMVCQHRVEKTFSSLAYEKGLVIVRCPGCKSLHLVADNIGWFQHLTSAGRNIEEWKAASGEERVIRGTTTTTTLGAAEPGHEGSGSSNMPQALDRSITDALELETQADLDSFVARMQSDAEVSEAGKE